MNQKFVGQPSPNKEAVKQALREGMSTLQCALEFHISERTVYRYLAEIQNKQHAGKPSRPKEARSTPIKVTVEMEFADMLELFELAETILEGG